MPAFAKDVFHGNASTLGLLSCFEGAGSVVGALFLTSRKGLKEFGRWVMVGNTIFGLGLIFFGSVNALPVALLVVAIIGFASSLTMSGSMTIIQIVVEQSKRGRVMSLMMMAFMGFSPVGCIVAGEVANAIGLGQTVVASGVITLILAFVFFSRVSRIYLNAELMLVRNFAIMGESSTHPSVCTQKGMHL
jgi:MFS family permease